MVELLGHNEKQYGKIAAALGDGKRDILVTQDTGTGKGYLAMALCQRAFKGKKILYVAPRKSIFQQFLSYGDGDEDIECATYNQASSRAAVQEMLASHDAFLIDEAHHLGSDVYGRMLLLLKGMAVAAGKPFIGFTATPVRDSDGVDVADHFSTVLNGYTLFECIQDGLVKPFDYIVCSSDMVEQLNALPGDGRMVDGKILKIDFESSEDLLQDIVSHNKRDKWLVFFASIKDLEEHMGMLGRIFEGYPVIPVHSGSDEGFDHDALDKMDRWVVASVDMLVEGIHLDGSEGCISFRNVHSLRVFRQMVGRLTAIGSSNYPLVIDCTESAYRMLAKLEAQQEEAMGDARKRGGRAAGIFNVRLDNKRYFDLMKLYEKAEEFLFHGNAYRHFAEVADENGWDYRDFLGWKNRQDWKGMSKEEICAGYEAFLEKWEIRFLGATYRNYEALCAAMSWSPVHFKKWRDKEPGISQLSRTEVAERYHAATWEYSFYFHGKLYPLFDGLELIRSDMGWDTSDFYAYVAPWIEGIISDAVTTRDIAKGYEERLKNVIVVDGRFFDPGRGEDGKQRTAEENALAYLGADGQEYIDWRRESIDKKDRDAMTASEMLQAFADARRGGGKKEMYAGVASRSGDIIRSTTYVEREVVMADGQKAGTVQVPEAAAVTFDEARERYLERERRIWEGRKDPARYLQQRKAEADAAKKRFLFVDIGGVLAPDGWLKAYGEGKKETPMDPAAVAMLSRIVRETDAEVVLHGEQKGYFDDRMQPVGGTFGQAVIGQLRAAGIELVGKTPSVMEMGYYARSSRSARAKEISRYISINNDGGMAIVAILDDTSCGDYSMEARRVKVDSKKGLTEADAEKALRLLG